MALDRGESFEQQVRAAAFAFLDGVCTRLGGVVRREHVASFQYAGDTFTLLSPQQGITKPRQLSAALSIRTVHAERLEDRPYDDDVAPDGFLRYKWRGFDPHHADNRALRDAMQRRLEMVWFRGIASGMYVPIYPVWLVDEEPDRHQFVVALDAAQLASWSTIASDEDASRYGWRIVRQRLHQPMFRAKVILAYDGECALCRLRHVELLDAAHIRDDALGGQPVVRNGISMCKIHHAAFDVHIVGIRPDHVVEVRRDVLDEIDGPTLQYALQALQDQRMKVPSRRGYRPDPELLEERYEAFRKAG